MTHEVNMDKIPSENKAQIPSIDEQFQTVQLNKMILEAEILRQQAIANNIDLWSAKFNKLADLVNKVGEENPETKKMIEEEMSRLLNNIVQAKI